MLSNKLAGLRSKVFSLRLSAMNLSESSRDHSWELQKLQRLCHAAGFHTRDHAQQSEISG